MGKIYFTSDLHFGHDRGFIYEPRGYKSVDEMNKIQIEKFNSIVTDEDDVYILGDLVLGDIDKGIECLKQLKGKIHVARGNHDSDRRIQIYKDLGFDVDFNQWAIMLKYKKCHFYCSHFPTITPNLEQETMTQTTLCLYGHTHQQSNFYQDNPYIYHVGVDSHDGYPVDIDTIIENIKTKVEECKEML